MAMMEPFGQLQSGETDVNRSATDIRCPQNPHLDLLASYDGRHVPLQKHFHFGSVSQVIQDAHGETRRSKNHAGDGGQRRVDGYVMKYRMKYRNHLDLFAGS